MTPYRFIRTGRNRATIAAVAATWGLAFLGWAVLDAALWIIGFVLIFTLPALWDICASPQAGLEIDAREMRWWSGRRNVTLGLGEIDHIRLDTRLDLSVRATAILRSGKKLRLPPEATPPAARLTAALDSRNIPHQRHHFSFR